LLALLGGATIVVVSRLRVKTTEFLLFIYFILLLYAAYVACSNVTWKTELLRKILRESRLKLCDISAYHSRTTKAETF